MLKANKVLLAAAIAHQVNQAYCSHLGDDSQVDWGEAERWQIDSAISGVNYAFDNSNVTPEEMHLNWCKDKEDDGWVYGEEKDPEAKTHPCLVPYEDLPEAQRLKDLLFSAVTRAVDDNVTTTVPTTKKDHFTFSEALNLMHEGLSLVATLDYDEITFTIENGEIYAESPRRGREVVKGVTVDLMMYNHWKVVDTHS